MKVRIFLSLWLITILFPRIYAQYPVGEDSLDVVVITANRYEVQALDVAEMISTYSLRDQRELAPRSMAEALIGVPGVWMQKTNHGGGSPFIRGLTGNQTLVLVDGIRLNNATFRYGPNQYLNTIDPLSLHRVEVLRGSASVEYGTDALGGAVNLLSKTPQFSRQGEGTVFHGSLLGKYLTGDGFMEAMELSGRAELQLQSEKFALHIGGSLKDFGDLVVGGDSLQNFSSYSEWDVDAKARFKLGESHQLTLAYQGVNQSDVGRYDQVAQRGREFFFFDPQDRHLSYARWEVSTKNPWLYAIQTTLSYQVSFEGRRQKRVGGTSISHERDEVRTLGFTWQVHSKPQHFWDIVTGVEYYRDEVSSTAFEEDEASGSRTDRRGLYPDGASAHNYGLFTLHSYERGDWRFSGGLRLNGFSVSAEDEGFGNLSINPLALVGNLSAMYKLSAPHRIFLSFNSGFRAPNINDMSSFGSFDSGIEVPNDDLEPERTQTWEVGYKAQTGNWNAQLAFYRTDLKNLIARVPAQYQGSDTFNGEPVFQKENVEKALIQGIEAQAQYTLAEWEFYTHLAYTYGEDEEGNPLRRIPPLNGRLGAAFRPINQPFWFRIEGLAASKQDRLSGGDQRDHRIPEGGTPGWQIVNVYGGLRWNGVDVNLGLLNVGDQLYRFHGSGVDAYGRSLSLSLRYSW